MDEEKKPAGKKKRELVSPGEFRVITARNLSEDTCKKFGYSISKFNGQTCQVAPYYNDEGRLVAQKLRLPGKEFVFLGDPKEATLFGQRQAGTGGKRLVITEGEIDAMSVAQAFNLSWPAVSVPNGASGALKSIKENLEFVESFEEVVFMFDMDEPGQKAAKECAELLTPGKAKIASLPLKDANDLLKENRVKDIQAAVWNARSVRPDGIMNGADLWDEVSKPLTMGTPYPWEGLNKLTHGLRKRELVTISAGSGIGKSAVVAEVAYHLGVTLKERVGYVALEESAGRSCQRFLSINLNKPIHLDATATLEEKRKAFGETLGKGNLFFFDHFGSLDSDNLMAKLRYLVKGCGCQWVVLDHLSIVVSGMALDADERRAIDKAMTDLRSFVEETGCGLILVSHLKRPEGRGHEEGARTSLAQLRGSAAIAQLSDMVIGLERNQQADTPEERNTTIGRVLKNRFSGETGVAVALRYESETGRLIEIEFVEGEDGIEFDPAAKAFGEESTDDLPF
jgi:twinkle protein